MLRMDGNHNVIGLKNFSCDQSISQPGELCRKRYGNITSITNKILFRRMIPEHCGIFDCRNDTDNEKVDYLYQCRNEFIRCPESVSTAKGRRYIPIIVDEMTYSIPSAKLTLPSGKEIYQGLFKGNVVISDGDLYHIESLAVLPQPPRTSILLGILGLLTDALSSLYSVSVDNSGQQERQTASRHYEKFEEIVTYSAILKQRYFLKTQPIQLKKSHFVIPFFNLPGIEAEYIDPKIQNYFPYLKKNNKSTSEGENDKRSMRGLASEKYDDVMFSDRGIDTSKVKNACQMAINIPNHHAMQRHYLLNEEYMNKSNQHIQNLKWLEGYDTFLAEKLNTIFHEALYLKRKKESLETMLIKKYCERLLNNCMNVPPELIIQSGESSNRHRKKIKLNDYFYSIGEKLKNVCQLINFEYLREAVELKNGMGFEEALDEIKNKYSLQSENEDQETYINFFHYIRIMHQAHKHYCNYLGYDAEHSPLDKLLFLNDKEIYWALLDENQDALINCILIRFFYYIFEFNRNHGISIYGNSFMLPGEFTEHWSLFARDMELLNVKNLTTQFSQQISEYFLSEIQINSHLERVLIMMEYSRVYLSKKNTFQGINEDGLSLITNSISILENNIKMNLHIGPGYFDSTPNQWHIDRHEEIKYDKECLILLDYIKRLHVKFYEYARYFDDNALTLSVHHQEQRVLASKVAAMRNLKLIDAKTGLNHSIILEYQSQVSNGNVDVLINAVAFWFMDCYRGKMIDYNTLNVLEIIKEFQQQEWLYLYDMETRNTESYTSVFDFYRYNHFDKPEGYFNQFVEYRLHDAYHEARNISFNIIKNSPLDFIDLVYPAKNSYTFKIFSRKYIQNTLVPDTWVSQLANNLGYITLIQTHTDKVALVSTLLSAPFIRFIEKEKDSAFIIRLIEGWESTLFDLRLKNRLKIATSIQEIFSLLFPVPLNYNESVKFHNSILIEPEDIQFTNPTSEFTLIADKTSTTCESLLSLIDYWSEQTLLETSDELKEELMDKSWVDYITSQIPFYNVLWNYWYDPGFEFHFRDIIFDVFDIITTMFPVGVSANKLTKTGFINILTKAKDLKIPPSALKAFVFNHFMLAIPDIMLKSTKKLADELVAFINPIPFYGIMEKKIAYYLTNDLSHKVDWINDYILDTINVRKTKIKSWAAEIDRGLLALEDKGIFSRMIENEYKRKYIEINGAYYEVFWDVYLEAWRVKKTHSAHEINYAVPIDRNHEGRWVAASFRDTDPISPFHELDAHSRTGFKRFHSLHFEPVRVLPKKITVKSPEHALYKKFIAILLDNLKYFLDLQDTTQKDDSIIFREFALCLGDEEKLVQALKMKDELFETTALVMFVKFINEKQQVQLKFRVMRRWVNEFDLNPSNLVFVYLVMGNEIFIVDLKGYNLHSYPKKDSEQIQFEYDWLYMIKTFYDDNDNLIKYKDFPSINSAYNFITRSGVNPGRFIKGAFILKEPIWYKPSLIKHTHTINHKKMQQSGAKRKTVLEAARIIINSMDGYIPMKYPYPKNVEFPFRVLKEADMIDHNNYKRSIDLLAWGVGTKIPVESFMFDSIDIHDMSALNSIRTGSLLGVFFSDGLLHHLMVCVGFGRFAGMGNNFFNFRLSSSPSIIVSEEMGHFTLGQFYSRASTEPFRLIAGISDGVVSHHSSIFAEPPSRDIIDINLNPVFPHKIKQFLTRFEVLLGKDWSLTPCNHSDSTINITMHPSCLVNNHVIVSEFAHVVRAMIYSNPELPDLNNLRQINFATCFDGNDGQAEFSQILANELQLQVHTHPYHVTDSIRQRNSQWFTV